jgi:L-arabinonolactonase
MGYEVERVLRLGHEIGEGPLWSPEEGMLYWVDIPAATCHRWKPGEKRYESFVLPEPIGCLGFRQEGGFIVALKNGLHFWSPETQKLEFLVDPEADKPWARFNDGAVDRAGRFWTGTMDDNGNSKLYRYDPDGSLHVMETGITCSNGIGFSPDNRTFYYSDSQVYTVYAYDFKLESGEIGNRRIFRKFENGDPDGITVDSEGFIWVAVWGGWDVERYDPDGTLVKRIEMPVQYPTCPIFGGEDLNELYVTSAKYLLNQSGRQSQPMAGDLFCVRTDVKGLPEPKFAG